MDIIYLVIGLFVGGLVIGLFLKSKMGKYEVKTELLENGLTKNEQELTEEREKATNFQSEISKLETVNQNLQEKL
ncbi:MAG: hypothetical protein KAU01_02520, partial [Candidatus Cloacimonetes bacterium]|nr:hypothetical protein [Candidatus Cloacimonadota bacterium]